MKNRPDQVLESTKWEVLEWAHSPKTSIVNKYNQVHTVPNVYVTDGAFMTSSNCVNPSLTYMAFTARAANHAVKEFKAGKFS